MVQTGNVEIILPELLGRWCQAGGSGYQFGSGRLPVTAATADASGLQLLMGFLIFVPPQK